FPVDDMHGCQTGSKELVPARLRDSLVVLTVHPDELVLCRVGVNYGCRDAVEGNTTHVVNILWRNSCTKPGVIADHFGIYPIDLPFIRPISMFDFESIAFLDVLESARLPVLLLFW